MMPLVCVYDEVSGSCLEYCLRGPKFTGKERDTESGFDMFAARYYASNLGRFSSPDPVRMTLDMTDPQTLNKYSYVFNRPTALVDPDGEWPMWFHHVVIEDVFGPKGLNLGARAITTLESASDWVDSAANQEDSKSYMHSMRVGGWFATQTVDQAEALSLGYINSELDAAVSAQIAFENKGQSGLSDDALDHFGHALHTATDATSPEHAGYQPWCWECPLQVHNHITAENRSAVSDNASDAEARHQARVAAAFLWERYQAQLAKRREEEEKKKKKGSDPHS
jgi:RHS repeat-associated protein